MLRGSARWLTAAALGLLVVLAALRGHADAALMPATAVHVGAMAAWLGGLLGLLIAERGLARSAPEVRTTSFAAIVDRFGVIALPCAALVLATGAVQAIASVDALEQLVTTPYGRLVAVKLGLAAGLIALAASNRFRLQPRLRTAGGTEPLVAMRAAIVAELALAVVALGAAGLLAGSAPPG